MLLVEILFVLVNAIELPWSAGYLPYWILFFAGLATGLVFGLDFILLLRAARARNLDARLLLPGLAIISAAHLYGSAGGFFALFHPGTNLSLHLHLGIFKMQAGTLADILIELSLLVFLTTRTVRIARERNRAASELEAARSVQQVLVPEHTPPSPASLSTPRTTPRRRSAATFFRPSPSQPAPPWSLSATWPAKGCPPP